VHSQPFQPRGFREATHQIHVLYARVRAAFADAVEDAEDDDPVPDFIKIQSDVAKISPGNGRDPWVRPVLPGGANFLGQVKNFDERFVFVESAVEG